MTSLLSAGVRLVPCLLLAASLPLWAEDTVTIPKSRLQELERKEAELRKLQGGAAPTNVVASPVQPAPAAQPAPSTGAPPPAVAASVATPPAGPRAADLPPYNPGDVVEAVDLANQFRADPIGAEQRYKKQSLRVHGEVIRFHKRLMMRGFTVVLKTADPVTTVVCDMPSPETYEAIFIARNGSELVGQNRQNRSPIARIGDRVTVSGRCKGLKDGAVSVDGSEMHPAP